jgi:hypothetical protein
MTDTITRPPERRSALVRVLTLPLSLLLIFGTVVAGAEIVKRNPGSEQVQTPFVHTGQMHQPVDGLAFTATGESVRGAKRISEGGDVYSTDGVFVLVTVTVTAGNEPVSLAYAVLLDRAGRIFQPTSRYMQPIDKYTVQPGTPVRGEYVYEVPASALNGLVMQLSKDGVFEKSNQTVAQLDLGVDSATAGRWRAESGPLEVAPIKVNP